MNKINLHLCLVLICMVLFAVGCTPPASKNGSEPPVAHDVKVRGDNRLTGRAFLISGEPEPDGYGLYSYVLFPNAPHPGNRDRNLAVLNAFLGMEEVKAFEAADIKPIELNITYLPLKEEPPEKPTAEWLLEHYDYARAIIIADAIDQGHRTGPLIASYTSPIRRGTEIDLAKVLVQNLAAVLPDMVFLWVREFMQQVRSPQYWKPDAVRRLMLGLRTKIAVFAQAFGMVGTAQADIIKKIKFAK